MAQSLSEFTPVAGLANIWCARRGSLRCTAIKLKRGGIALFSPVQGLTAPIRDQLQALGTVRFLLAPNHFHNKALLEYSQAFPDAVVVAPSVAHERLTRITGLSFTDLPALAGALPASVKVLTPAGLKTGEVWLRIKTKTDIVWVVVDAFCTRADTVKSSNASMPELLGTFSRMAVADKAVYSNWVREQATQDQPNIVIPCHGLVIRSGALPKRLGELVLKL